MVAVCLISCRKLLSSIPSFKTVIYSNRVIDLKKIITFIFKEITRWLEKENGKLEFITELSMKFHGFLKQLYISYHSEKHVPVGCGGWWRAWQWRRRLWVWEEELVEECRDLLLTVILQDSSSNRWLWLPDQIGGYIVVCMTC